MGFGQRTRTVGVGQIGCMLCLGHSKVKYYVRGKRKQYGQEDEPYRKIFARFPILLAGAILFFSSHEFVRHAVKRSDYFHVLFVLLAFPLFAAGCTIMLWLSGIAPLLFRWP